jgi:hypothetical protein
MPTDIQAQRNESIISQIDLHNQNGRVTYFCQAGARFFAYA